MRSTILSALLMLDLAESAFVAPCAPSGSSIALKMMAGFGKPIKQKKKSFEGKKTFEKQMESYTDLRIEGYPPPNVVDVYVHAEGAERFWFVGKSCSREGAAGEDGPALSVVKQKRLVLEHAKLLQPREFARTKANLELWSAPPNSEVSVSQRQQGLRRLDELSKDEALKSLEMSDVGFLPEQYTAEDGKGFYVRLPPDGQPDTASTVRIVSPEEAAAGGIDLGGR